MAVIKSTTQYSLFGFLPGNRSINPHHVRALSTSILANNLLEQHPIIVNEKMEVVDGQHRLEVARVNHLEIYYIVKKGATLTEVHLLNSAVRPWGLDNYLRSYCELGKQDYIQLREFCREHGIATSQGAVLLRGVSHNMSATGIRSDFKMGTFTITDLAYAEAVVSLLEEITPYLAPKVRTDRDLMFSLGKLIRMKGFDTKRFREKLHSAALRIERQANVRGYLKILEDIYNWHVAGTRVRFY